MLRGQRELVQRGRGGEKKRAKTTRQSMWKEARGQTLELKTEGALKRQQRRPEAEVRSGLIRYDTRHGSLPLACSPSLLNQEEQCSEQKETWLCRDKTSSVLCGGSLKLARQHRDITGTCVTHDLT